MPYELPDIKAALVTILQAVPGIGNVHDRSRWTNDPAMFKTLFFVEAQGVINGTCVTRSAYRPNRKLSHSFRNRQGMLVWSVYSFNDSEFWDPGAGAMTNTEAKFQALVDAQVDAINAHYQYTNAWHCFEEEGDAVAEPIEIREWAGRLVHYCEIKVIAQVRI
jgi:hypothetical protein